MANILTAAEAAAVLRTETTDALMLALLPAVDAYIKNATGRDWTKDAAIAAEAKSAARMLLVMMYDNPAGTSANTLSFGLTAALTQLEALAGRYHIFEGRNGAGSISVPGAAVGDTVSSVTGLVGASGDQSAAFEAVISVDGAIQQISTSDLEDKYYSANLTPLEGLL